MDLITGIKTRRSIRAFEDKDVSDDLLKEVIDIARYYPSWKNTQTVRFIAIKDKFIKDRIAKEAVMGFEHNTTIINGAPVLMILETINNISGYERDGSPTTSKGSHFQSFDAGLAAEAFSLALHAKGLASVILGIYDENKIKEILGINEDVSISCLMPLGYAKNEAIAPKKREVSEILLIK